MKINTFLIIPLLVTLTFGCNKIESNERSKEFAHHEAKSFAQLGFAYQDQPYVCQNRAVFEKTVKVDGVARMDNLEWLRDNLKKKLLETAALKINQMECHNSGYSEQRLHNLQFVEHESNGTKLIYAKAQFVCCDNDAIATNSPRPRGVLFAEQKMCKFLLGNQWNDPIQPVFYNDNAYSLVDFEGKISSIVEITNDINDNAMPITPLSGSAATRLAASSANKQIENAKIYCKYADPKATFVLLNFGNWIGREPNQYDPTNAMENYFNHLAYANGICCVSPNSPEQNEPALGGEENEAPLGKGDGVWPW